MQDQIPDSCLVFFFTCDVTPKAIEQNIWWLKTKTFFQPAEQVHVYASTHVHKYTRTQVHVLRYWYSSCPRPKFKDGIPSKKHWRLVYTTQVDSTFRAR